MFIGRWLIHSTCSGGSMLIPQSDTVIFQGYHNEFSYCASQGLLYLPMLNQKYITVNTVGFVAHTAPHTLNFTFFKGRPSGQRNHI